MKAQSRVYSILIFGDVPFDDTPVSACLMDNCGMASEIVHADSIDQLIELLISAEQCIIVVDWDDDEVPEAIESLKNDEVVALTPVIAYAGSDDAVL